jgi:hypothetical protein
MGKNQVKLADFGLAYTKADGMIAGTFQKCFVVIVAQNPMVGIFA